jgi:hypothetical protein
MNPNDRYLAVNISLKDENNKTIKQMKYYTHRLIVETLIPNINNCKEINHKNKNKLDNRLKNLEWSDRKTNLLHSYKTKKPTLSKPIIIEDYIPIISHI